MATITLSGPLAAGTYALTPVGGPDATPGLVPLVLHLSEDTQGADARADILLDGRLVAAALSVTALHARGLTQDVPVGMVDPMLPHSVTIRFLGKRGDLYLDSYSLALVNTRVTAELQSKMSFELFIPARDCRDATDTGATDSQTFVGN